MDIKSVILIGGGLLIAAVILHGFWIAWRSRREPYRLDIVPDLIPDDVDDMERLRGELPNGGARLVNRSGGSPRQDDLDLDADAPLLLDPLDDTPVPPPAPRSRASAREAAAREAGRAAGGSSGAGNTQRDNAPAGAGARNERRGEPVVESPVERRPEVRAEVRTEPRAQQRTQQRTERHTEQRTEQRTEPDITGDDRPMAQVADVTLDDDAIRATRNSRPDRLAGRTRPQGKGATNAPAAARGGRNRLGREQPRAVPVQEPVRELLIIHVLADGGRFEGAAVVEAMQHLGLRYGDMNIFHRVDPLSKLTQYSIANAVEPGTFDLAELERFSTRGLTFFLQLPGPEEPGAALDDMLHTTEELAHVLGGVRKDENLSVFTGQTAAHYRQRVADFARRRLSMRA